MKMKKYKLGDCWAREQAVLSNWMDISVSPTDESIKQAFIGYSEFEIKEAILCNTRGETHIIFKLDTLGYHNKRKGEWGVPSTAQLVICLRGNNSADGTKLLRQLNDTLGLGKVDDTKLYIGAKIVCWLQYNTRGSWSYKYVSEITNVLSKAELKSSNKEDIPFDDERQIRN